MANKKYFACQAVDQYRPCCHGIASIATFVSTKKLDRGMLLACCLMNGAKWGQK